MRERLATGGCSRWRMLGNWEEEARERVGEEEEEEVEKEVVGGQRERQGEYGRLGGGEGAEVILSEGAGGGGGGRGDGG